MKKQHRDDGGYRATLEELRNNRVPRYLFRVWSDQSGGGPSVSINTPREIVPPAFFMNSAKSFYSMDRHQVRNMADAHYGGDHTPLSGFSSWAASLHLVLSYAAAKSKWSERNVHVAILDRYELDHEVFIWHVPHLLAFGVHEYLAYGCISGKGYVAVPFPELLNSGLDRICPEIKSWDFTSDHFGHTLRTVMFKGKQTDISSQDIEFTPKVASAFGDLALPVAIALLSIRKRSWNADAIGPRGKIQGSDALRIQECLGGLLIPKDLQSQKWLMEPNMVNTKGFPDVQQWIDLLYYLVHLDMEAASPEPKNIAAKDKKRKRNMEEEEEEEKTHVYSLRDRDSARRAVYKKGKYARAAYGQ